MNNSIYFFVLLLGSVLLQAVMPAIASDYTLEIFGNANMDDTIDQKDVAYVEGIIKGTNAATNLSDANYDGKIDAQDIDQIEKIARGEEKNLTIIDEMRPVTISGNTKRIVPLTSYVAETISALGCEDRIVAMASPQDQFLPELKNKESVGKASEPDLEKIFKLNPDLVIAYQYNRKEDIEKLEEQKIPVVCFRAWTLNEELQLIRKMGVVLHKEDRSKELSEFIEGKVSLIKDTTKNMKSEEKPQIFYEVFKPYQTMAVGTYIMDTPWGKYPKVGPETILMEIAGGVNCAGEQSTSAPTMDSEWVINKNPDIFIEVPYASTVGGTPSIQAMKGVRDAIIGRAELKNVKCIKNKDVYVLHPMMVAGTRQIIGLCYFAKWFHPDLFSDLDPNKVHQEMLKDFWGLELNGTWEYPENKTELA
jgi:iron complex transport system substrate-binding protein